MSKKQDKPNPKPDPKLRMRILILEEMQLFCAEHREEILARVAKKLRAQGLTAPTKDLPADLIHLLSEDELKGAKQ